MPTNVQRVELKLILTGSVIPFGAVTLTRSCAARQFAKSELLAHTLRWATRSSPATASNKELSPYETS